MNVQSVLWVLSATVLTILGRLLYSPGPDYEGGIYYIGFSIIYVVICFLINHFWKIPDQPIPLLSFLFATVVLLFSEPLYENDQYRYLWEGRVVLHGENPYVHAPDSEELEHIPFEVKERIGYPRLSSIYPPLSLLWLSSVSAFSFDVALRLLMILNAGLCFLFLSWMYRLKVSPLLLLLIYPYIQKEFIQGVHIDLFAVSFILIALIMLLKKGGNVWSGLTLILMSFWSKLIGIAVLPLFLLTYWKKRKLGWMSFGYSLCIPLSLFMFFWFLVGDVQKFSGGEAFSNEWVWNEGFYGILMNLFDVDFYEARTITFLVFAAYAAFIFFRLFFKRVDEDCGSLSESVFLLYAGLMFFSPVFNGWYAVWFLPFALLSGNVYGALYAVFSSFAYMAHGHFEWYYWGTFFSHIWFVLIWIDLFLAKRGNRSHMAVSV